MDIETKVNQLLKLENEEKIVKTLQDINRLFLTKYMIRIDNTTKVYPVEVEAYYCNIEIETDFRDELIHNNLRQSNHDGKLYVHKKSGTRAGIDVCLSNTANYSLSILIRGAYINDKLVYGINNVLTEIMQLSKYDIEKLEKIANVYVERDFHKYDYDKDAKYIFTQKRILDRQYAEENFELNSLLITEINNILFLKPSFYRGKHSISFS